ncbi:MAG: hypothetical protein MJZ38_04350 [archaeon]|nr:hypothetical protein [archaeon]
MIGSEDTIVNYLGDELAGAWEICGVPMVAFRAAKGSPHSERYYAVTDYDSRHGVFGRIMTPYCESFEDLEKAVGVIAREVGLTAVPVSSGNLPQVLRKCTWVSSLEDRYSHAPHLDDALSELMEGMRSHPYSDYGKEVGFPRFKTALDGSARFHGIRLTVEEEFGYRYDGDGDEDDFEEQTGDDASGDDMD